MIERVPMNRSFIGVTILLLMAAFSGTSFADKPADPQAIPAVRSVLNLISGLPGRGRLIAGQQIGMNEGANTYGALAGYPRYVEAFDSTASKIGLVGADYSYSWKPFKGQLHDVNQPLITHWNGGGLVTVMYSMRNPWTGGTSNDQGGVNLAELLQRGTAANRAWLDQLDEAAEGLLELQAKGVVVLWRPFHELNGSWFWWGYNPGSSTTAANLWRYLFTYFTATKGIHNLLWVYAATTWESSKQGGVLDCYPGDAYVDIVGLDIYKDAFTNTDIASCNQLLTTGKPFIIAEFGPGNSTGAAGAYDYTNLLSEITGKLPRTSYFLCWSDWNAQDTQFKSLISNRNSLELLRNPVFLSRRDIASSLAPASADREQAVLPAALTLSQNYPNPFNSTTIIPFSLDKESLINIRIYNIIGQIVTKLGGRKFSKGSGALVWKGLNSTGSAVPAGIYVYVLTVDGKSCARTMMLLK
jgi:mannan endo-1,4-beta-mannosidase